VSLANLLLSQKKATRRIPLLSVAFAAKLNALPTLNTAPLAGDVKFTTGSTLVAAKIGVGANARKKEKASKLFKILMTVSSQIQINPRNYQ
jgi:hypothetical protein